MKKYVELLFVFVALLTLAFPAISEAKRTYIHDVQDVEFRVHYDYINYYIDIYVIGRVIRLTGTLMIVLNAFKKCRDTVNALEKLVRELGITRLDIDLVRPM